jgi:hypothetical protein
METVTLVETVATSPIILTTITVTFHETYFSQTCSTFVSKTITYHTFVPTSISIEYTYATIQVVFSTYSSSIHGVVTYTISTIETVAVLPTLFTTITVATVETFYSSTL